MFTKETNDFDNSASVDKDSGAISAENTETEPINSKSYLQELENELKMIKVEKVELIKDYNDALDRIKQQDVELKDAISQRNLAMREYSEVTDKLSELRSQKQKLSRQVKFFPSLYLPLLILIVNCSNYNDFDLYY